MSCVYIDVSCCACSGAVVLLLLLFFVILTVLPLFHVMLFVGSLLSCMRMCFGVAVDVGGDDRDIVVCVDVDVVTVFTVD